MSVQWYLRKGTAVYGPLSAKALYSLAETGQLKPTDEVLREDLDRWVPASKVKGLKFIEAGGLQSPILPSELKPKESVPRPQSPAVRTSPRPLSAIKEVPVEDVFDPVDEDVVEEAGEVEEAYVVQKLTDGNQRSVWLMSDGTWRYGREEQGSGAGKVIGSERGSPANDRVMDERQEYYKLDSTKITLREYAFDNPWLAPLLILIGLFSKVFRVRISGSTDDPPMQTLGLCEIQGRDLPEYFRERLEPMAGEVSALGFHPVATYVIEDPIHKTTSAWMTFKHPDGNSFARLQCRQWRGTAQQDRGTFSVFVTEFRDGTYLMSSAGKPDLLAPPACTINRQQKKKADKLWESHQKYLREKCGDRLVRTNRTSEEVRSASERLHRLHTDFHLQRGVFKPLEGKDLKGLEEASQKLVRARSSGLQNPEVIAELEKIQDAKPSWVNAILLLVVSAAFFMGIGAAQWSWRFVLMLIPILFFHELGHYLAMLMFGYKNLKMFFIPFFGAAVSGRHYNVAGWKKVIVSLAGPLPGILAGVGLGIYGLYYKQDLSMEVALLMLILNGFNLIPVLPLDGGWVMHAILFCRHPLLDTAFRVMAGLGLILLGGLSSGRVMIGVAVMMFMSLPVTYRIAKITDRLRKQGGVVISPDAKSVPIDVADKIITELRTGSVQNTNNKQLAQLTLQVFEGVNATPPNWLASLFFLAVHFGTFCLAAVFALVIAIGQQADLGDFVLAAAMKPETPYTCGSVQTWSGPKYESGAADKESTLVAPFKDAGGAKTAFEKMQGELPATARMTLFGSTLMIQFPPAEKEAQLEKFKELEQTCGKEVFICQPKVPLGVSLTCLMNELKTAERLQKEIEQVWQIPQSETLIAPWHRNDTRTPEEKARHQLARSTYQMLLRGKVEEDVNGEDEDEAFEEEEVDPVLKKLYEESQLATRTGDKEARRRISEQIAEHEQKQQQAKIDAIRNLGPEKVDVAVIDAYEAWMTANRDAQKLMQEAFKEGSGQKYDPQKIRELQKPAEEKRLAMLKLLGQVAVNPGAGGDSELVIQNGHLSRAGPVMSFHLLSIRNGATGLPAFAEWLCSQGCSDVSYDVRQGFDFNILEEGEGDEGGEEEPGTGPEEE